MTVYGCEVETAAPLRAAIAAGGRSARRAPDVRRRHRRPDRPPRDVAGGARLLAGSLVVSLAEVESAIRVLVERAAVVAEGAGAASVAAALQGLGGDGPTVCVVSGGNIDPSVVSQHPRRRPALGDRRGAGQRGASHLPSAATKVAPTMTAPATD